jgi:hypothetical protein
VLLFLKRRKALTHIFGNVTHMLQVGHPWVIVSMPVESWTVKD